ERWRGILDQRGIPSLSLGAAFTINSNTVAADIDAAYRQLTEHHIAQGSRTIRLILPYRDPGYTGSLGHSPLLRARGFRDAILKAGGTFQAEPLLLRQLPPVPAVTAPGSDIVGTVLTPEKMDAFSNMFEMGGYVMEKMIERRDIPDSV